MHIFIAGSHPQSLINFRGPFIQSLMNEGHSVSVSAPNVTAEIRAKLLEIGVSIHETVLDRRGTGMRADLSYYSQLRNILRRVKPDILLSYTIKPNIWGAFAASSAGIPSYAMVTGLGYAFTDTGAMPSIRQRLAMSAARWLYRMSTRHNQCVIFQNPDDLDDFAKAVGLTNSDKTAIVSGSGVDMTHYARTPIPNEPVVLMIARLLGSKGVRDYAAAARSLRPRHPLARFLLVGPFDDGLDAISPEEVAQWTADGLEYLGPTDDVRPIISQSRIFVLPSYREGTPRSVLEAMAMGRPIITCDAPGCRETVEDGVNGLLVPVRDPQALATAIERLLQSPAEVERMGNAGYELVAKKYDVRLVNFAIMQIMGLTPSTLSTMHDT
jgi:glycosyltransferase involved in cell wall biosynthesis